MKICIIGGGSSYTPELIEGLIRIEGRIGITEIVLLDIGEGAEKLRIVGDFSHRLLEREESKIGLSTSLDPVESLTRADVVINQFRAGGLQSRIRDEKIPLKYDLLGQETTGIGGLANGLRSLPIIDYYVGIIRDVANDPWIVNFSNPSGMITEYILNELRYEKCIGLCNVPIDFILTAKKIFGCERSDVFLKYYGLNHLAWIEEIWIRGEERSDELWKNFNINKKNIPDIEYQDGFLPEMGLLLNSYLRYFYNPKQMIDWEKEDRDTVGTRGEEIIRIEKKLLELYSYPGRRTIPDELEERGGFMYSTVAAELLEDLFTDSGAIHIVNTRNSASVGNMPGDYVMEIPCRIRRHGPEPVGIGEANLLTIGLIHTIKSFERLIIKGYVERDENLIKQAMMVHPLGPNESDLNVLWDDLKRQNAAFFPRFG